VGNAAVEKLSLYGGKTACYSLFLFWTSSFFIVFEKLCFLFIVVHRLSTVISGFSTGLIFECYSLSRIFMNFPFVQ
jgi:hypothetical protein